MSTQSIETPRIENRPRLIDRAEVERLVGMKRSAIYVRMSAGLFPKPVSIGGTPEKATAVRWIESEIDAWVAARIAERDVA